MEGILLMFIFLVGFGMFGVILSVWSYRYAKKNENVNFLKRILSILAFSIGVSIVIYVLLGGYKEIQDTLLIT